LNFAQRKGDKNDKNSAQSTSFSREEFYGEFTSS